MKSFILARTALTLSWSVMYVASTNAEPSGMAKQLIEHFRMQQIPQEGPWFSVTYVSDDQLPGAALPARYKGKPHAAGSAIYCVLTREDFSALHKLETDETWHFYSGDPIKMLLLHPDGHGETIVLGPDVFAGQHPQFTVRRGVWQGSAPTGTGQDIYSFVSVQLAPGFDYGDFQIGYRDELQMAYPDFAAPIAQLTREEFTLRAGSSTRGNLVFSQQDVKPVEVAPGMFLRELVGRLAAAKSEQHSVAAFTLEKGQSTLTSYNKVSEETFLITSGRGQVILDEKTQMVRPGSVVFIPPGVWHALRADRDERLEFYAVEAPAYRPEDFVAEPKAAQPVP